MSLDELQRAYERFRGTQRLPEGLLAAARRQAAREWLGGSVEGLTAAQVDEILELACYDKACAPPPAGKGGSLPEGWRKGAEMLEDDDTGEPMPHLLTSSVGFLGTDASDEHHERWEGARERFRSSDDILRPGAATRTELVAWQNQRQADLIAAYGRTTTIGPGEAYASQIHVREPDVGSPLHTGTPIGVEYGGKLYVMDGHHRVVSKWARGERAEIDVVDLDRLEAALTAAAEELACRDASCAPPPVGTGGSKPAGAGGGVATVLRRGTTAERVALAESLFNHDLPHGFSARVTSDSFDDGVLANPNSDKTELFVEGKIVDANGGHVGHFERHIELRPDGTLVAHHDTLVLDPQFQGMGLAQSFTSQSIAAYQKIGVERIEVLASMQVGAFAWARQGYEFEAKHEAIRKQWVEDRLLWVKKVADAGIRDKWSMEDATQMKKAAQDLINASNRGEPVQPIHVASLGEQKYRWTKRETAVDEEGRLREIEYETWPGKEVLLAWNQANPEYGSPDWSGVKYLDGRDESVAAGATEIEEFYNPSQPRDKEGQWTRSGSHRNPDPDQYGERSKLNPGDIRGVAIRGYKGEELQTPEGYKYHGPRHVADSMDPELRRQVTSDLLNRRVEDSALNVSTWVDFEDRTRDMGISNAKDNLGLMLQLSHLYESVDDPNSISGPWTSDVVPNRERMDQVRNLISEYDNNKLVGWASHKGYDDKAAQIKLHDDIYKVTGVDATTGLIGAVNRSWQVSASDTISVAAHLTVAKTHELYPAVEGLESYMRGDRIAKAQSAISNIGEANMKAITDATYEVTQSELARLFGDETLTVYRGIQDDSSLNLTRGGSSWVQPSPLSSWSTNRKVAEDFAKADGSRDGYTMRIQKIPHKNVYSLATITGMGSLSEQEVVLLGHDYDVDAYSTSYDYDPTPTYGGDY